MKTLWCKIQENPSDRISHAWAPLKRGPINQIPANGDLTFSGIKTNSEQQHEKGPNQIQKPLNGYR